MISILVVDDSPVIRRMLNLTLKKAGFSVLMAADGDIAFEFLQEMDVDLALIDINMPNMDGLTLLRKIRGVGKFAQLPVVMLTSSGEEHDRLAAEEAGINGYLNKPAGARELITIINQLIQPEESI